MPGQSWNALHALPRKLKNMSFPTTQDIGREALTRSPENRAEHLARLIRRGWLNQRGELTRILGGDAEPEPWADSNGGQRKPS
jgi:hypothetical protein